MGIGTALHSLRTCRGRGAFQAHRCSGGIGTALRVAGRRSACNRGKHLSTDVPVGISAERTGNPVWLCRCCGRGAAASASMWGGPCQSCGLASRSGGVLSARFLMLKSVTLPGGVNRVPLQAPSKFAQHDDCCPPSPTLGNLDKRQFQAPSSRGPPCPPAPRGFRTAVFRRRANFPFSSPDSGLPPGSQASPPAYTRRSCIVLPPSWRSRLAFPSSAAPPTNPHEDLLMNSLGAILPGDLTNQHGGAQRRR